MKAIVSLFISAYQPGMASIECHARSLNQSHRPWLCDEQPVLCDKQTLFCDEQPWVCDKQTLFCDEPAFEAPGFEGARFEDPSYEDICWMLSRARRSQPLGYCVMYLRYVGYHSGYAKAVGESLRQQIALHPDLKDALSTFFVTWLQQQEDLFCQTLHQQLIEFHSNH
ncbi:hypothetical protein [uncultured Vibrio sp.]|uniref:hypothetical protein n=1 Tax=uncultured Vibrio sp. TaxID=114054 RepID=UPI002602DDC4|nr:hypothetical protein [uncultured Vibrio sp.]